ncbi:hypothetical protein OUZ56_016953 [Daphnia magna]|uniref:Uncharacterized protein n=1 Tax=Daphnia magna TaxID=35525 RepID=A0ABR0ARR0_9CRUS|nr:hypothetical protein OUZ56_016953 [Daphnia magna]
MQTRGHPEPGVFSNSPLFPVLLEPHTARLYGGWWLGGENIFRLQGYVCIRRSSSAFGNATTPQREKNEPMDTLQHKGNENKIKI